MTDSPVDAHAPPSPPRRPLVERVRDALARQYNIEREIGRGGMAVVYLARGLEDNERVAVKVLPPEWAYSDGLAARFIAECDAVERLKHPNIVRVVARGRVDDLLWFAMEYIDGRSLADIIRAGPIKPQRAAAFLAHAAGALSCAHRNGIIHRDIKPANMLVRRTTDELVITDFGIAKTLGASSLTETGATIGTVSYMSPEQLNNNDYVGPSADQYSLGVVAYEMLTGMRPYKVDTPGQLAVAQANHPLPPVPDEVSCPPDLARLVERMLLIRARWRWPDLEVVAEAAAEIALSGAAPSLKGIPSPQASTRRKWVAAVGAIAILVAGVWYSYDQLAASKLGAMFPTRSPADSGARDPAATVTAVDTVNDSVGVAPQANVPVRDRNMVPERVTRSRLSAALRPGPSVAQPTESTVVVPPPALPTTAIVLMRTTEPGTLVKVNGGIPIRLDVNSRITRTVSPGQIQFEVWSDRVECTSRAVTDAVAAGDTLRRLLNPNCPDS